MPQPMLYTEARSRPELLPWVAAHWHFRVAAGVPEIDHFIPLHGGVILSVRVREEPMLTGPRTEPHEVRVRGGFEVWGSHFWPGAAPSLLGIDACAIRSREVPARQVVGEAWAARLAERFAGGPREPSHLLDEALAERLPDRRPLDETVMLAVFRLLRSSGEGSIGALAAAVGLSPRQLRRRFRREVGLSPKELARIERLRASATDAALGGPAAWVDIAARHGYSDQAHLVREFRELLGLTPRGFEDHARRIYHGELLR